jgi:hypothetical protein
MATRGSVKKFAEFDNKKFLPYFLVSTVSFEFPEFLGTTSKETVETRSYGKHFLLWSNSPNFWVDPRRWGLVVSIMSWTPYPQKRTLAPTVVCLGLKDGMDVFQKKKPLEPWTVQPVA